MRQLKRVFRHSECELNGEGRFSSPLVFYVGGSVLRIGFYEIDEKYVDYMGQFAPHLFHNKQENQQHKRKYIGILLTVNGYDYFAPLSSFKPKHQHMKEVLDFMKVGNYAVINLNNMFPVPARYCHFVDFSKETDLQYKKLLESEYRIIKARQDKIFKNAATLYHHKICSGEETALAKRCNDFRLLEEKSLLMK